MYFCGTKQQIAPNDLYLRQLIIAVLVTMLPYSNDISAVSCVQCAHSILSTDKMTFLSKPSSLAYSLRTWTSLNRGRSPFMYEVLRHLICISWLTRLNATLWVYQMIWVGVWQFKNLEFARTCSRDWGDSVHNRSFRHSQSKVTFETNTTNNPYNRSITSIFCGKHHFIMKFMRSVAFMSP